MRRPTPVANEPSRGFSASCGRAGVAPHVVPLLWALHSQKDATGAPRWSADSLLADHALWRQYVRSRAGDAEAGGEFSEHWSAEIAAFCGGRFSAQDRDELTGQFFARVYRLVGPDYAWSSPFGAYLRTIFVNLARDLRARSARSRQREPSLEARREGSGWEPAAEGPSPERHVLHDEEVATVTRAMNELSPGDQFIVNACLVDGLSGAEVGDLLGLERDAVYQRLHRARARLKKLLAAAGMLGAPRKPRRGAAP